MTRSLEQTGFLLIYGAGGHGLVVAEAAEAAGWKVVGFLDDAKPEGDAVGKWKTVARSELARRSVEVIVAIGDNALREKVTRDLSREKTNFAVVIHPTAWISPTARIADGAFVGPLALVHAEAEVGTGAIVNSGAIVEHHCKVGDFAHLAPRVALGGRVTVGRGTLMGVGAVARPDVTIGESCTVGAGAAVVADVKPGETVAGVPAKPIGRPR